MSLGKLIHMVQDSYSESHTARDAQGRVLFFQNYSRQDSGKHKTADDGPVLLLLPGAMQVKEVTKGLLGLRSKRAGFAEVEAYLRNSVYVFAPGAAQAKPAGTVDRFAR